MSDCTRCGATDVETIRILVDDGWSRDWSGDLCSECYREFNQFMKRPMQVGWVLNEEDYENPILATFLVDTSISGEYLQKLWDRYIGLRDTQEDTYFEMDDPQDNEFTHYAVLHQTQSDFDVFCIWMKDEWGIEVIEVNPIAIRGYY